MNDLDRARALFAEPGCTLALVKGEQIITSTERGIRPLMKLLAEKTDCSGWSAADLVVGRAAAFLYVLLGVKAVYAQVVSRLAEEVLRGHGIAIEAQTRVDRILSVAGGNCPMETAVEHCTDAEEAYAAIRCKLRELAAKP